jgi:coupling of ubiquitin conjugation to ER degradation protein 1
VPAPRPAATPARAPAAPKAAHPDLITRYNLASKIGQDTPAEEEEKKPKAKAWSQDRTERQANLQRKREEMILAARRKMEEKERLKAGAGAA